MSVLIANQFLYIGFGAAVGFILSFAAAELLAFRKRRIARFEEKKKITRGIIKDTLKFFFKANDILNDLWVDKEVWAKFKKESPEKSFEFEQKMLRRFDDSTRGDFFNELMFYAFQLKLLEDSELSGNFDSLMDTFKELSKQALIAKSSEEYVRMDKKYKDLKNEFLGRCMKYQMFHKTDDSSAAAPSAS